MLTTLILIPIIGAIILMPMHTNQVNQMKKIALNTAILNFIISLFIWFNFDSNTTQYQFVSEFNTLQFCHLNFGIDGISLYFVLLTTFISPIAILSNYKNIENNMKLFLISLLLLESLQICAFVSLDLLLFYIFFESVLPILFIVIILFGHGIDRFRSAFLLFLYTLGGSLPMLLSILMIYNYIGSTDLQLISLYEISLESQKLLWLGFFIAFAVKTPLYPFIIWLPKAHSDSPLAGSILLAATILKLATYGYLRVLIQILPDATNHFSPLIQSIAIISLIYASFSTIIQQDTKRLIAYSSVCHMAVVVLGLFSNTLQGIEGAILLGLAHGFVSPALFICVGGVIYDRTGTRIIKYIRGLATYMPVFTILFFVFTLANTGIPLTLNFLGEQLSLLGIWQQNPIIAALGATGIVLSAVYSIFLYNRLSYGDYSPYLAKKTTNLNSDQKETIIKDINRREYYLLLALLIPTVILGLVPNVLLNSLHLSVSSLLYFI
jgi:proton-translocating NADH-quinone oxidoreductase, chain M